MYDTIVVIIKAYEGDCGDYDHHRDDNGEDIMIMMVVIVTMSVFCLSC